MKFTRRADLDQTTRLLIIAQALLGHGIYGRMSALARQYAISRTFLYQLLRQAYCSLDFLVSVEYESLVQSATLEHWIILLRLEGRCSIASISDILKFMNLAPCSTGMISERLKQYGSQLPSTLKSSAPRSVVYLSDEIFALSSPILITIEPESTAILKIELAEDRTAVTWEKHFNTLKKNNYIANGLSSDRGNGIIKGFQDVFPDADWFSDLFHEFRDLTKIIIQLEKKAYAAIDEEAQCLRKFDNARSENNLQNRLNACDNAEKYCRQAIERYDRANELTQLIWETLYFFDHQGYPKQQSQVKQDLLAILSLLDELNASAITKETHVIKKHIEEITLYFKSINTIWNDLLGIIPENELTFICLAWQYDHFSHQTKSDTKKHYENDCHFLLSCVIPLLGDDYESKIHNTFNKLDKIVRSSSLVEMVNSHMRPYFNSCKGQITQETLNLIMFYHNHRRYKSGKRKQTAPIELLTGVKLEKHWVELLLDQLS